MNNPSELAVTVSRIINAPPRAVYEAWLNPELLAQFMIPSAEVTIPQVAVDAREGGRFTLIMAAGDKELPHSGEYKKLTPYSQIIFTWESHFSAEGSTVTLNLTEDERGTQIELIHIKFINEIARNNHENGWGMILSYLEKALT